MYTGHLRTKKKPVEPETLEQLDVQNDQEKQQDAKEPETIEPKAKKTKSKSTKK